MILVIYLLLGILFSGICLNTYLDGFPLKNIIPIMLIIIVFWPLVLGFYLFLWFTK